MLGTTNQEQRLAAALALARTTGDRAATPILAERSNTNPQEFIGNEFQLTAIGRLGNTALIDQLGSILAAVAAHESARDFSAVQLLRSRGQTNEARTRFAGQLQTLAHGCDEQGSQLEQAKALRRLTESGYGTDASARAWAELLRLHTKAGDWKQAVAALAQTHGVWGIDFAESARMELADAIHSDNYTTFRAALLHEVRSGTNDDTASNLIGLCQQIAQRLGHDDTAARLANEAKLGAVERDEAIAWDSLIENWEIAGPYSGADQTAAFPPELEHTAKLGDSRPKIDFAWKKTDPKQELGILRLAPLLGMKVADTAGKCAYARTTIDSPEDRRVTSLLGSDDWLRVWVNGELVHTSPEPRSCALDQDRVTVNLKKRANKILLKIGNLGDAWNFCFRIAEGSEGLSLSRN